MLMGRIREREAPHPLPSRPHMGHPNHHVHSHETSRFFGATDAKPEQIITKTRRARTRACRNLNSWICRGRTLSFPPAGRQGGPSARRGF
jgi:hypothetical protein